MPRLRTLVPALIVAALLAALLFSAVAQGATGGASAGGPSAPAENQQPPASPQQEQEQGLPGAAQPSEPPTTASEPASGENPFSGNGMWIWQINKSSGGDVNTIVSRAAGSQLTHVIIKAADGSKDHPGFTAAFVGALRQAGLRVCGYQRVFSSGPKGQARKLASQIKKTAADCAVIDAEAELEGRYTNAKTYMKELRSKLGSSFPIALSSFPWVTYHPQFPYSVFLGPDGAQFNLPQIYWKDIGVSVSKAFANTYSANPLYGRPIYPIGQLYQSPSKAQLTQFRTLAARYGADGTSWWAWEHATTSGWEAATAQLQPPTTQTPLLGTAPTISQNANSDLVRWARIRMKALGVKGVKTTTNRFDSSLKKALNTFQRVNRIPVTGKLDPATWQLLAP